MYRSKMMRQKLFFLLLILSLLGLSAKASNDSLIDSLKELYTTAKTPNFSAVYAYQVAKEYAHESNYDSAMRYANIGIAIAKKENLKTTLSLLLRTLGNINNAKGDYKNAIKAYEDALKMTDTVKDKSDEAKLLNNLGTIAERRGDFSGAFKYFNRALKVFGELNEKKGMSECYNNLAMTYHDEGNNPKSIEYNILSLKLEESLNSPYLVATTQINLGNIYADEKDYTQAVDYYNKAVESFKKANTKAGIGQTYGNIGLVYMDQKNYDKALEYFNMALSISQEIGSKRDMADIQGDLGSAYFARNELNKAMESHQKALALSRTIGDQQGTAEALNNVGRVYFAMGNYKEAQKAEEEALIIATRINAPIELSNIHKSLSEVYTKTKQSDKALDNYRAYVALHDSLNNEENSKKILKSQLAYQFEKEQQAQQLQQEKKDAIAAEASRREKAILWFVIGILVLVLIFSGFLANRFIVIHKQKKTIEAQKVLVENKNKIIEEKNKDITDSINYARDIQKALLPDDKEFKQVFPESFILYLPKDIVSGDFYWLAEKDGKVLLLAADCTGHGVPGALMSMIGVSLFNETVEKKDIVQPGHILSEVRSGIIHTFKQRSDAQHKDGMDAALCCIDLKTLKAEFAGAYNPVWVVPQQSSDKPVMEITPDKQPIGIQDGQKDFTTQSIQLNKGDTLYLFSDGYADQFGGPNGKKFKYKQFQEVLLSINKLPMSEQKAVLEKKFLEWKGDLEQVDDVLVMGIRV